MHAPPALSGPRRASAAPSTAMNRPLCRRPALGAAVPVIVALVGSGIAAVSAPAIEMFTFFGDGSRIGLPSLEVPIEAYPGIPLRSDRIRARRGWRVPTTRTQPAMSARGPVGSATGTRAAGQPPAAGNRIPGQLGDPEPIVPPAAIRPFPVR